VLEADVVATLTSTPVLTLAGAIVTAVGAYFVSRWQTRPSIEKAREDAIQSAYKMGDELRDELRGDLKDAKAYAKAVEVSFVERVNKLQKELEATRAELRVVKRMRCPRDDCPVFREDMAPAE